MLSFEQFAPVYHESVDTVLQYLTPQMQAEMAKHNAGWGHGSTDFALYLRRSAIRFYKGYRVLAARGTGASLCDVGGFWGVFPMTLTALGFGRVTMTEALGYYSSAFDGLFAAVGDRGVSIVNFDPFDVEAVPPGQFDVVTVMAVLEHYPHSLRQFMEKTTEMLAPQGRLYIEVPNIAFWPKRVSFLRGHSPLVHVEAIYNSATPFIGHHHEFTMAELHQLARLSGLRVVSEDYFNYSVVKPNSLKQALLHPAFLLANHLLKDSREILAVEMAK